MKSLVLQDRDRKLLGAIFKHRYLTSEHIHRLFFAGVTLKRGQRRLRELWVAKYVDRTFLPFVLDGRALKRGTGAPLYTLRAAGAHVVAEDRGLSLSDVPHTPSANAKGYATLNHHLVATDLMVALTVACRNHVLEVGIERESELRTRLARLPPKARRIPMPDGAVTLSYPGTAPLTFYLEVVRALAKGGNRSILDKLQRYVEAQRAGRFLEAFGHTRVRAVLFATTSPKRAEHYLRLAERIPHGARQFWFGVYSPTNSLAFDSTTLLDIPWQSVEGTHTLRDPTVHPRPGSINALIH